VYRPINLVFDELRKKFIDAVKRNGADGILFSGGLDSALVAAFSRDSKAISVGLDSYSEDQFYAKAVAKFLNIDHHYITVSIEEALAVIPEVIRIVRSFDPVVPNDVAVYIGLKYAKDIHVQSMMTGDGSDEIFAGYSFMREIEDLDQYLTRMHSSMRFSSNQIGFSLGLEIRQPFLDDEFVTFGRNLDVDCKIRHENGMIWGKWILRKAFEGVLPKDILWQSKRALEYGSGMTHLRKVITDMVSDEEFECAQREYPVKFWNKEHFYYYRIYRKVVGEVPTSGEGQVSCRCCGAGMGANALHCKVCGDVPEWKRIKN
jgi:asparagine synthase (glutamine-hydrolysing)